MLQQKPKVFSTSLSVMIDFSVQSPKLRYQSFFVITPQTHPPSLNPFHLILNPCPVLRPLPLCHPIPTPHLSFILAPRHPLVFIPCPLHNSVPDLDLSYWLCADPAKKQRRSFGFNYSCVMRGSGFSPLQAKKKSAPTVNVCVCARTLPAEPFCVSVPVFIYSINLIFPNLDLSFDDHY